MKKLLIIALAVVLVLVNLCACTGGDDKSTYKIGLCNYVDDASLNQIVENIKSELEVIGKENNVTFKIYDKNCEADVSILQQIITNFNIDNVDLMVGIATPVAIQMQTFAEDKPVIFAAVSDPVGAGLVDSLEKPGANITGTSDYLDTNAVMNLMFAVNPNIKKVGLLYDLGQDSSKTAIDAAKKYLADKGIEVVEKTGKTVDEVVLAANSLVADKVDAVFTPTDNTIMKAELSIYEIFQEAKIPHYTGADSFALNGAFLGYGVDYINLGKETARMIADVLINGKDTSTLAVKTFDNGTATVNTETCEKLGLDIEIVKKAIEPYCTKVQTITTSEDFQ